MSARGVGILSNSAVPEFLRTHPGVVDYLEVIPETLWVDQGSDQPVRFQDVPRAFAEVDELAKQLPIVAHGISLSIGSTMPLDREHLAVVDGWLRRYKVARFSEHLGFSRVAVPAGGHRHTGLGFPLPCDEQVLSFLAERVSAVMDIFGVPFILENGVRHTPYLEEDMSEARFLSRLAEHTGSGVLLDLHNLYTDCRNHHWSPDDYLGDLDLDTVLEIHVAGGSMVSGVYTDSHAGPCPPVVWELLERVAPACRNLQGITFEFHDSYYPSFGPDGLLAELDHIRRVWRSLTARVS